MKKVTLGWIADVIQGLLLQGDPDTLCPALSTDSRSIKVKEIFCALKGERFDGHDFVGEAINKGAAAVIVEKGVSLPPVNKNAGIVAVDDSLGALGELAAHYRRQFDIPVVAVTGSNGKTTTKEMIATILSVNKTVLKNEGNLNNLIGLPLSLLKLTDHHKAAVLELGMNHKGEIARLTEIADPLVGVITNVGPVHLEYLGSIEAVAQAKGELFATMSSEATAIVNNDDPQVQVISKAFPGKKLTFGIADRASVRARNIGIRGSDGVAFDMVIHDDVIPITFSMVGEHNVMNALAAAAVATALGETGETIATGLSRCKNVPLRQEIVRVDDHVTIINDCYNANPVSMEAALVTFSQLKGDARGIVVLGDMLELGSFASDLHREVGNKVARTKADYFVTIGEYALELRAGAIDAGFRDEAVITAKDLHELTTAVLSLLDEEPTVVLVKGSRKMALERIVESIIQDRGTVQPRRDIVGLR
jgi:UDP-N-acetylmuramoyl-tripeptide--D-alanyl-D-alanine ligase